MKILDCADSTCLARYIRNADRLLRGTTSCGPGIRTKNREVAAELMSTEIIPTRLVGSGLARKFAMG